MNEELREQIMATLRPLLSENAADKMEMLLKMEIGTYNVDLVLPIEYGGEENMLFVNLLEVFLEIPEEADITRVEGAALLLANVDNTLPVSGKSLLSVFKELLRCCNDRDSFIQLNFPDPVNGIKRIVINGKRFGLPTEIVLFTSAALDRFNAKQPCKKLRHKEEMICVLHYDF